jgi:N-acetyl sugar amidotransferase
MRAHGKKESRHKAVELKRCRRCVIPETQETLVLDDEGVCNICRQHEYKQEQIDWVERKHELGELIDAYRGKYEYDCIVPFSGGKDSTFTLYHLVTEYGLKPLVVRFDHGFLRPRVLESTIRTVRQLGVAFHHFTPNWKVVQKLMLRAFLDKGDFCWHCHTGIFAYPMWVAIRQQIPLVFWGEPSAEYTAYYSYDQPEEVDEKRFNRFINLGISARDMFIRLGGNIDERDLKPFTYPPLKELRKINYRSVCLGSYIPWDVKKQTKLIQDELGWKGDEVENVPPGYEYEKIECYLQGVRDYIKYIKRGFARTSHLTSLDIRNNRMDRVTALALVKDYEGKRPPSLELFLEIVGITEEEFYSIAMTHGVSPYEHDLTTTVTGKEIHDFAQWPRCGAMPRREAQELLKNWYRRN